MDNVKSIRRQLYRISDATAALADLLRQGEDTALTDGESVGSGPSSGEPIYSKSAHPKEKASCVDDSPPKEDGSQ